ncbi:hypothetical protein K438DRAFT_1932132 [Mycena galopus ATCC 62051]|nr:hypothetical protein K438DRAFT_1932132 [Mycena galopus ATCC 62051]
MADLIVKVQRKWSNIGGGEKMGVGSKIGLDAKPMHFDASGQKSDLVGFGPYTGIFGNDCAMPWQMPRRVSVPRHSNAMNPRPWGLPAVWVRVPFKRVDPSRIRPFPKQPEWLYGRDGNRRDGPSTRRKRKRVGALVEPQHHGVAEDMERVMSFAPCSTKMLLDPGTMPHTRAHTCNLHATQCFFLPVLFVTIQTWAHPTSLTRSPSKKLANATIPPRPFMKTSWQPNTPADCPIREKCR